MIEPIVRVYDSPEQARSVMEALREHGFGGELSNIVLPTEPARSLADIATDIRAGYVLRGYADAYAACVQRGQALISVRAPLGTGKRVTLILDAGNPAESGVTRPRESLRAWDEAAPISSALNMPVLMHGGTPLSSFWKLPVLLGQGKRYRPLFGNATTPRNPAPFSGMLGLPLSSNNGSPLSSMLGLPLVTKRKARRA